MMPSMTLKRISKAQPMREGEVAVVDYLNGDLTKYLEQETSERIAGINEFKGKVEAEKARAEAAEGKLIADLANEVNSRKADSERLTTGLADERTTRESADTKLTSDLGAEVTERKTKDTEIEGRFPIKTEDIKDGAVGATKLDTTILAQLSRLDALPLMEYGLTTPVSVEASSHTDVTITYASPKAAVPVLVCSVVCQTNALACSISQVTTTQAVVRVENATTAKVDNVSIAYFIVTGG